jgi:hypothetical protein
MRSRRLALLLAPLLAGSLAPHRAEPAEHGRLGILAGFSDAASLGGDIRVSGRVALRPRVSYSWLRSDNAPTLVDLEQDYPVFETTERYLGVGLDALLTWPSSTSLEPYVGLSLNLRRSDVPYPASEAGAIVYRNGTLYRKTALALVGAQYNLNRHLAIYGEAAFGYSASERFGFGGRRLRFREWGTASPGVGVIFYFR